MEVALQRDKEGRERAGENLTEWKDERLTHCKRKKKTKNKSDNIELVSQVASVTVSESSDHSERTSAIQMLFPFSASDFRGTILILPHPCRPLGCLCLSSVSLWPPLPLDGERARVLGLLELLTPIEALRWFCRNTHIRMREL